jgi:hypothetical protein
MRENTSQNSRDRRIAVFAIAIFVCVFLGPFDTGDDLSFWDRVVFWTVAISTVGIFMEICILAAIESKWLTRVPMLFTIVIGSALGSVPGTSFVIALNKDFRPEHLEGALFPMLWFQVTVMGILIAGLELLINSRSQTARQETQDSNSVKSDEKTPSLLTPRLLQRLPTRLREGQIISMSMQDHYVEVTTTKGSEMILMRLSDAIDLLDGIEGVQTHRSHWAARAHASSLSRVDRRHQLALKDGRSVPVSNSYRANVEQMLNEKGQT